MIINGGSRSNGGYFAKHLMRADHNERVEVVEIRGLAADNIRDAFREMKAVASGTKCSNYFYHANVNTREDEQLTPEQWLLTADTLERSLGLTDQPRFVVEHEKDGRTHRHIIWSRIDADNMTAISDSLTYPKHERAARELEEIFGHEPVPSVLVKDRDGERPERNPKDWESLRAQDSKIDPKVLKAELTELWRSSDTGQAFAAALEEHGYILARGDRRDFCIIDRAGDEHSLGRRLSGVKAAEIRERMAGIDREALPSVAEGRALARLPQDAPEDTATPQDTPEALPGAAPPEDIDTPHAALLAKIKQGDIIYPSSSAPTPSTIDDVHNRTIVKAIEDRNTLEREEQKSPGSRLERLRNFWGSMRERFDDWRDYLQERVDHYRSYWDKSASTQPRPEPEPPKPEMESER